MFPQPPLSNSTLRDANGKSVITYTEAKPDNKLLEVRVSGEQRASVKFDPATHRVWNDERRGEVIVEPHPRGRAASG